MPFHFRNTELEGVILITPQLFPDHRGYFGEVFKLSAFLEKGVQISPVQANLSFSRRGVLRGLHYQLPPAEQGKLVEVVQGRILDVAVDVRKSSETYGKHVEVELRGGGSHQLLWIPPGFAHGFQALEDSLVLYFVTKEYSKPHERCISWDDPEIGIVWPLKPILSEKDSQCPNLSEAEVFP